MSGKPYATFQGFNLKETPLDVRPQKHPSHWANTVVSTRDEPDNSVINSHGTVWKNELKWPAQENSEKCGPAREYFSNPNDRPFKLSTSPVLKRKELKYIERFHDRRLPHVEIRDRENGWSNEATQKAATLSRQIFLYRRFKDSNGDFNSVGRLLHHQESPAYFLSPTHRQALQKVQSHLAQETARERELVPDVSFDGEITEQIQSRVEQSHRTILPLPGGTIFRGDDTYAGEIVYLEPGERGLKKTEIAGYSPGKSRVESRNGSPSPKSRAVSRQASPAVKSRAVSRHGLQAESALLVSPSKSIPQKFSTTLERSPSRASCRTYDLDRPTLTNLALSLADTQRRLKTSESLVSRGSVSTSFSRSGSTGSLETLIQSKRMESGWNNRFGVVHRHKFLPDSINIIRHFEHILH